MRSRRIPNHLGMFERTRGAPEVLRAPAKPLGRFEKDLEDLI